MGKEWADDFIGQMYAASYRRLVVQMYGVSGDLVEAEEAVQEAFVRACAHAHQFRTTDSPEAWLRTVAVNVLRSRWRKLRNFRSIRSRLSEPTDIPGVSEDHVLLMTALRQLSRSQREAVALFYLADLSVREVARVLGVTEGTVKARLSRGRAALAELLSDPIDLQTKKDTKVNDHA